MGSENRMICVSRESSVTEPCVVMRNMRQVMNGLKNYTGDLPMKFLHFTISSLLHYLPILCQFCVIAVNSGEGEVARLIQRERECLRPDQFFDVDMVP